MPELTVSPEMVALNRGPLEITIELRPFSITVRRNGRRLLRNAGVWVAQGQNKDHFVQYTEGVVAGELLDPSERATRAHVKRHPSHNGGPPQGVELALRLGDERHGTLLIEVPKDNEFAFKLTADPRPDGGEPLRLALDWDRRSIEHFVALGIRHATEFDHRGRRVQLGADRRYTGPDCPPEMLAEGGIPQGDCAPTPFLESSRGYAVLAETNANGTIFDFSSDRTCVSTRHLAGPLSVRFFAGPSPAARLRQYCAATGFPALLPEWAYGFWKSRDVHEDREAVLDDFNGFREHNIPLDAIVIDSPWATQYNSWEFNPHQLPDAEQMVTMMRSYGVRTVLWCTPWVNLDSRDGQIPPQPESERLHAEPAPNYEPGVAGNHFVRTAEGIPYVGQWWMGTGSLVDFTSPAAEEWWRPQVKGI
ncbi:MAG: hypothetical protein J2O48_12290, partial [Solirubrobacterales bacterium]|nr:hypothetical protein [Solirubrobacterales bacterium]